MRSIFAAALIVCCFGVVYAKDDENPYKKAKVGDWVEYKMTSPKFEGTMKQTVTDKTDKTASLEISSTLSFNGKEFSPPAQKQEIDLTKPYNPLDFATKGKAGKAEKTGDGEAKIKVGKKEYATKWTTYKATGDKGTMEFKIWISKDAPLGGMVKMETTNEKFSMKVEMTGSGSK